MMQRHLAAGNRIILFVASVDENRRMVSIDCDEGSLDLDSIIWPFAE